jgi:hypothetical protein
MPTSTAIFWPVIAQVALIHAVYFLMLKRRTRAVRAGLAKAQDYRVPAIEPAPSATAARSLVNQFELPVLFFLVCILFYLTAGVNHAVLAVAWQPLCPRLRTCDVEPAEAAPAFLCFRLCPQFRVVGVVRGPYRRGLRCSSCHILLHCVHPEAALSSGPNGTPSKRPSL